MLGRIGDFKRDLRIVRKAGCLRFAHGCLALTYVGGPIPACLWLSWRSADYRISFARQNSNLDGSLRAAAASKLVVDRSRSPMESATALLLSMPLRRGGYALGMPTLNCRVALPRWLHDPLDSRMANGGRLPFAECDFVFRQGGMTVLVDYHGEWSDSGEINIHHDALRLNAFSSLDCAYFTLTKWQFYDSGLLDKVAAQIGAALGRKPRVWFGDYEPRKRELHRQIAQAVRCGYFESLCV